MLHQHRFIFHPGLWRGEGTVSFDSSTEEEMFFTTEWNIESNEGEGIYCQQKVKMEGVEQVIHNDFYFYDLSQDYFSLTLTSDYLDEVIGTGLVDNQKIAWEFRQQDEEEGKALEGFEVYELQDDGGYHFHAEYTSPDQFRTIINGEIKQLEK